MTTSNTLQQLWQDFRNTCDDTGCNDGLVVADGRLLEVLDATIGKVSEPRVIVENKGDELRVHCPDPFSYDILDWDDWNCLGGEKWRERLTAEMNSQAIENVTEDCEHYEKLLQELHSWQEPTLDS